jgi:hypothetical protein
MWRKQRASPDKAGSIAPTHLGSDRLKWDAEVAGAPLGPHPELG